MTDCRRRESARNQPQPNLLPGATPQALDWQPPQQPPPQPPQPHSPAAPQPQPQPQHRSTASSTPADRSHPRYYAQPWLNKTPAWSDRQGAERLDWVGWAGCDRATNILAKG